jgi:peptide deformylase
MANRQVARIGNPVLRRVARPLPASAPGSPELEELIEDMIAAMREEEGVGLAAPQVSESVRLVVIEVPALDGDPEVPLTVLINPVVTPLGEERAMGWEGCLSVPDLRGKVPRWQRVRLQALDRSGRPVDVEASGFFARVIQHECDHLDGIIYLDRMEDMSTLCFLPEFEAFVVGDEEVPCA